jgi:hypothetical protein
MGTQKYPTPPPSPKTKQKNDLENNGSISPDFINKKFPNCQNC